MDLFNNYYLYSRHVKAINLILLIDWYKTWIYLIIITYITGVSKPSTQYC